MNLLTDQPLTGLSYFATISHDESKGAFGAELSIESNQWQDGHWLSEIEHKDAGYRTFKSLDSAKEWLNGLVGQVIEFDEAEPGSYWRGFVEITGNCRVCDAPLDDSARTGPHAGYDKSRGACLACGHENSPL